MANLWTKARRHKKPLIKPLAEPGAPPGTLVADPSLPKPAIRIMAFGPDTFEELMVEHPDEIRNWIGKAPLIWVDVDGLGHAETIRGIGEAFYLHPLALEDVLTTHQRAKVDEYADHLYIVARMVSKKGRLETEQVSIFVGENFVITFQERPGDCLDPVRNRIRRGHERIRSAGPDFLAYSILDAVVDGYYPVLEDYGEQLERLEDEIVLNPDKKHLAPIHETKRDLLTLRRAIWPLREALASLIRGDHPHIRPETRLYFRDCYDHTIQIIDFVETYREFAADLMDVYLSSISNYTNEVIRVLTLFATVFLPLTFIVGIYGMNFNTHISPWNMPELNWPYGYPLVLGLMALVTVILLLYFRSKRWIGSRPNLHEDTDASDVKDQTKD